MVRWPMGRHQSTSCARNSRAEADKMDRRPTWTVPRRRRTVLSGTVGAPPDRWNTRSCPTTTSRASSSWPGGRTPRRGEVSHFFPPRPPPARPAIGPTGPFRPDRPIPRANAAVARRRRFGVGRPISVSREPSVPPRTIVSLAGPNRSQGLLGIGDGARLAASPSAMLRYCRVDLARRLLRAGNSCRPRPRLPRSNRPNRPAWRLSKSRRMMCSLDFAHAARRSRYGCKKPWRPSVVSGESRSCGNRARKSAATRIALVMRPLAIEGWMFTPRMVTTARSAENVSTSIRSLPWPSSV